MEADAAYDKFVEDNLKRNYLGNYLHGMLGMTGFRLVNAPTFLPAYLFQISGSNTIVGLGLALQQVGGIISPIFAGTKIEHRKKVMPAAVLMGSMGRLAILGIALSGWFIPNKTFAVSMPWSDPIPVNPLVWSVLFFAQAGEFPVLNNPLDWELERKCFDKSDLQFRLLCLLKC